MGRTNSGLQSMQSIEHALGTVEHDIMDKVADDWMNQPHGGNAAALAAQTTPHQHQGGPGGNERMQQAAMGMQQHAMHVPSSR